MSAFNALVDGFVGAPPPAAPALDTGGSVTPGYNQQPGQSGAHIAALQGTLPLTGAHNTPLHVAFIAIVAMLIVIALRAAGFRFSTVGKLSIGKG